jgi:putative salt-induced outer membrane protein
MKIAQRTLIAVAALVSAGAYAQTPAAPIKTDGEWRGVMGAALTATSGNSSSRAFILNADAYRATAGDKITVGGMVNYGHAGGVDTAKKWGMFGQYDYNLSPQLFAFGRLGLEADTLASLDSRVALAGGVGYKVINTPNTTFTVYGGLAHLRDKYSTYSANRTSLYLAEESTHKLSDTTAFKQRLDLYPGLTGDKAKIAKFTAGLAVAMSSTMSLNVGLIHTYNSEPPAGLKKGDTALFTGVNVNFGAK